MPIPKSKFARAYEAQEASERLARPRVSQHGVGIIHRAYRIDHAEPVQLVTSCGAVVGLFKNLSLSGVLIQTIVSDAGLEGRSAGVRLCDGRYLSGRIARSGAGFVGIEFDAPLTCLGDITHLETRGPRFFRGIVMNPRT